MWFQLQRCHITSVQRRIPIESSIVLLYGFTEVVSSQVVLAKVVVQTANVVEVEGREALPSICHYGRLGYCAEHPQGLGIVTREIFHIGLQELGTGSL